MTVNILRCRNCAKKSQHYKQNMTARPLKFSNDEGGKIFMPDDFNAEDQIPLF